MNQKEFVDLIKPFQDKLFRLAKRLLISREEAQDATQEVLGKLWSKNKDLAAYKSVEALAMIMTKNYCLDQLKSKRASNLRIESSNYGIKDSGLESDNDLCDRLAWVEKIIAGLPKKQRLILQLRDVEQYEFEEIAAISQMSQTAVRVTLSRARKTIRNLMFKEKELK